MTLDKENEMIKHKRKFIQGSSWPITFVGIKGRKHKVMRYPGYYVTFVKVFNKKKINKSSA